MTKPLRWSFICESAGPQRWYRAELMARGLRELGHEANVWHASFEGEDHTLRGWDPPAGTYDREPANVIVARLHTAPAAAELFLSARRAGQVVALDMDDDVWAFPDWAPPVLQKRFDPQQRTIDTLCIQANMSAADVVVAATPALGESCATVLDTIGESDVPVAKVRSPVLTTDACSSVDHDPLRVGWLGTWAYRGRDLEMILAALEKVLGPRGAIFRHLGRDKNEPPLPVMLDLPGFVIWEHDWVDIAELPPLLADLDLAVIPAEDHRFNRSRSATTGLALAACGVPFVASPLPEYLELALDGVGLVADTEQEWVQHLADLMDNDSYRRHQGRQGRARVEEAHRPVDAARTWTEIVGAL